MALVYKRKVVLIGSYAVGKTAMLNRFVDEKFLTDYKATIGVNLMNKKLEIENGKVINFSIWDIAGQLAFKGVWKNFYNAAAGALIIFDVTRQVTYDEVQGWYQNILDHIKESIPCVLVANKIDLVDQRIISSEKGKELADSLDMEYIETSAKTGENITNAFKLIGKISLKLIN
ncbi:MAG: GTP-binding protein [Candidatus Lokiarchaeota archaeon]|nr:GTP-binding protein [Candidatus Lokiarchaeota archaeon]